MDYILKGGLKTESNEIHEVRVLGVGDKTVIVPAVELHSELYQLFIFYDDFDDKGFEKIISGFSSGPQDPKRIKAFFGS